MAEIDRSIVLAARPRGLPRESDFRLREQPVRSPREGEMLVRLIYVSVDPYLRGLMNEEGAAYAPSMPIGTVVPGGAVGEVLESRLPGFAPGEIVQGLFGWRQFAVATGDGVRKVDPWAAPVSTSLGVLGMPGMTACFGLLEIGSPRPGETVVVSGAAGAVGSAVGQIARIAGCRAVGIAGGEAKARFLVEEMGFDAGVDYKAKGGCGPQLDAHCPGGVDIYFDNVGGEVTDAVFPRIAVGARVVVCGQISQYNLEAPPPGPRWLWILLARQARAEGFLVSRFAGRFGEGIARMTEWVREGRLRYREDIVEGIENAPAAFIGMLQGRNIGKQLVKVGET